MRNSKGGSGGKPRRTHVMSAFPGRLWWLFTGVKKTPVNVSEEKMNNILSLEIAQLGLGAEGV